MHVLELGPYPPPEGGINRNILAIRDELRAAGHRCSIIATSKSTKVTDEPDVHHPNGPLDLIRLIRSTDFDVLHLHVGGEVTPRVLGLMAACSLLSRGRGVLTLHSGGYPQSSHGKNARKSVISRLAF